MTNAPAPPPELARIAPGWVPELVYRLVPHLTTWRLTGPDGAVRFAKVDTAGSFPSLQGEAEHMIWAIAYLPVPEVVTVEAMGRTTVLVTEGLPGRDATAAAWHDNLPALVHATGQGLRRFHEAVGEEWCPFRFDLDRALDHVDSGWRPPTSTREDSTTSMPTSRPPRPWPNSRPRVPTTRICRLSR